MSHRHKAPFLSQHRTFLRCLWQPSHGESAGPPPVRLILNDKVELFFCWQLWFVVLMPRCVVCDFRMFSPTKRWAFLWTESSPSTPRESSYRSMLKPTSPRECNSLLCFSAYFQIQWSVWSQVSTPLRLPLRFGRLCEVVDHVFPLLLPDEEADFPSSDTFGQCNYWNEKLPDGSQQEKEDPQPLETSWGISSRSQRCSFSLHPGHNTMSWGKAWSAHSTPPQCCTDPTDTHTVILIRKLV